jgi:cytochrome c-type biogenesis protein CcmH
MKRALLAGLAALACLAATADDPAERLADPSQEARARDLFREVRCVVCQNESIDESGADIAADLRRVIRRKIGEGQDEGQIRDFLRQRYGDWILLKPPVSGDALLLWLAPALVVVGGGAWLLVQSRRRVVDGEDALTLEEQGRLAELLEGDPAFVPPQSDGNKPKRGELT